MTDSVRDRIAAVLHDLYGKLLGYADEPWDGLPATAKDEYRADADAVITALGLREETVGLLTRHVTEWRVHA